MSRRHRLALIGCGQIADVHARRLVEDGRGEIVVLCDPLRENCLRIQEQYFPAAAETSAFDEALNVGDLDGVIIATPTHLHAEQATGALARKLPVLCEKPLAETRQKIVSLIELAESPGMPPLVVGYQRRFWTHYRTMKREIDSGRWGKLLAISLHNSEHWMQGQAVPGSWRNDPQRNPGGYIGDAGSHKIDALFYLSGRRATEVIGQVDQCETPIPIRGTLSARMEGGVNLSVSFFGDAQHFREDLHIVMEQGDLVLRDQEVWVASQNELRRIEEMEPDSDPTRGFLDVLEGTLENPAPARCALDVFDFTMGILESSERGSKVSLR